MSTELYVCVVYNLRQAEQPCSNTPTGCEAQKEKKDQFENVVRQDFSCRSNDRAYVDKQTLSQAVSSVWY